MATAYEAMIKLSLVENVAAGLALIVNKLRLAEGGVKKLEEAFKTLKRTSITLGGALSVAFGTAMVKGVFDMAEAAWQVVARARPYPKNEYQPGAVRGGEGGDL